jgi:hypothetical protein
VCSAAAAAAAVVVVAVVVVVVVVVVYYNEIGVFLELGELLEVTVTHRRTLQTLPQQIQYDKCTCCLAQCHDMCMITINKYERELRKVKVAQ